jgi:hypothetical protein
MVVRFGCGLGRGAKRPFETRRPVAQTSVAS